MFRWALESQVHIKAKPKEVWDAWADAASWVKWDSCTKALSLEEPFCSGSTGQRKAIGCFSAPISIVFAEQGKRFCMKTRLFGAKVVYSYYVAPWWDEKVRVVQHIEVSGFFAPLLWLFAGRKWKKRLPDSMKNFSSFVENKLTQ